MSSSSGRGQRGRVVDEVRHQLESRVRGRRPGRGGASRTSDRRAIQRLSSTSVSDSASTRSSTADERERRRALTISCPGRNGRADHAGRVRAQDARRATDQRPRRRTVNARASAAERSPSWRVDSAARVDSAPWFWFTRSAMQSVETSAGRGVVEDDAGVVGPDEPGDAALEREQPTGLAESARMPASTPRPGPRPRSAAGRSRVVARRATQPPTGVTDRCSPRVSCSTNQSSRPRPSCRATSSSRAAPIDDERLRDAPRCAYVSRVSGHGQVGSGPGRPSRVRASRSRARASRSPGASPQDLAGAEGGVCHRRGERRSRLEADRSSVQCGVAHGAGRR